MTNFKDQYFNSGYSRHITSNSLLFSELNECKTGRVTFRAGIKDNVVGKRNIDRLETPKLNNVCLV